ncbi:MAG: PhoPQ-activated pathogenicity-related family protein [Verrucomicrobiota bacterium]
MKHSLHQLAMGSILVGLLQSSLMLAQVSHARVPDGTALDRYVYKEDPHYAWRVLSSVPVGEATVHFLEMTSQQWLTEEEVDRPIWKHWLTVTVPRNVMSDTALMFIGGGSNRGAEPGEPDQRLVQTAISVGTVVAELKMIPNQPLVFPDDGQELYEDALIAYTWDKYLRTQDEKWPARLPMTKAAVRAMDTITAVCASDAGGQVSVREFVVAGGSKRGWTTWTTAAVDKRVRGIFPIVIDMLNVVPSFKHHFAAYGFYAPAVGDYESRGIMKWQDTEAYAKLMKIVEPFEYRDRLTMPKYLINATGDQFFLPDSWRFYWDELQGPKHLRYVPNGEHSLRETDAYETLLAGYACIVHDMPMPQLEWDSPSPGVLHVQSKGMAPKEVKLWTADNPKERDFRVDTIGRSWKARELKAADADGMAVQVSVGPPQKGYRAFMVEMTFQQKPMPAPLKMTTGVFVIPDVLPHAEKAGKL